MNGIERAGKTTTIIQGIYDFIGYVLNFLFFLKTQDLNVNKGEEKKKKQF